MSTCVPMHVCNLPLASRVQPANNKELLFGYIEHGRGVPGISVPSSQPSRTIHKNTEKMHPTSSSIYNPSSPTPFGSPSHSTTPTHPMYPTQQYSPFQRLRDGLLGARHHIKAAVLRSRRPSDQHADMKRINQDDILHARRLPHTQHDSFISVGYKLDIHVHIH